MVQTTIQKATIVTEQPRVVGINTTGNPEWPQLVVRSEREKKGNSTNQEMSIFSAGNLGANVEKLIAWRTVHVDFLEAYGIDYDPVSGQITDPKGYLVLEGLERINDNTDLPEVFPASKIWVNETFKQRKSKEGQKPWAQSPKQNPSTKEILCNQGNPIYLNRELTFDLTKEDTYIAHDGSAPNKSAENDNSPFGALNA